MPEQSPDFLSIILQLIAGVVLFLYSVNLLSDALRELAGDEMRRMVSRFTWNTFSGVLTGTVATTILDSSSAVIIMVISMVNVGLLTSLESFGVVLGANIGTTVSSQIIALNVSEYSPLILLIGFILHVTAKSNVRKQVGLIVFAMGLLFFGLWVMDNSMMPLRNYPPLIELMKQLETPLVGALVGGLVTLVLQSSSATVGIAIILASQGVITLPAGVAVMLGAEIGTCSDTLLAVIGRSREAIRTGLFHLIFNILSVTLGLIIFEPFTHLIEAVSGNADLGRKVANAHMAFNIMGVLVFVWFIPLANRLLKRLLPDKAARTEA
ncbi:MAG: Na/Pi cotransporter family protein [Bacteroidetes bacterium]|nr:MAG: Na/Pi cotransporter family protein [Bacteroidota bacterium]